ncbi:MAG: hypothetical protein AAGA56_13640, partial [Myxococcota bacterium]
MTREAQIPFLLWLPAAFLFHAFSGGGAYEASAVISGRDKLLAYGRAVREEFGGGNTNFEVDILGETEPLKDDLPSKEKDDEAKDP